MLFSILIILSTFVLFYVFKRRTTTVYQNYKLRIEELEEQINLLEEELNKKNILLKELPPKAKRIFSIENIAEKLVNLIDPDQLCQYIVKDLGSIFPEADNVLLFLVLKDSLVLHNSLRKKNEIIREKRGDILDWWVLKKNQCLLIEDLASDYRFDFNHIIAFREREAHSLVSSPLSIGSRILGLVRLESKLSQVFSLEDSRALRVICDLGAVVLERANLIRKTKDLATKDSLTDLFLRNYFTERFDEEIKRASFKRTQFGIVILDIDDFKKINDTYGHTVGDMVLKKLASILQRNVGDSGNVASRLGGEEFVFLIVESNRTIVKRVAERIRKEIEKSTVSFRRKNINFTVSLGLAMYPKDGIDTQQLLCTADHSLYRAKREGKNKLCST